MVLGLGVRPNTELAADSGIPLGVTGGVRTDLRMRVVGPDGPIEGLWAAGDCVQTTHLVSGQPVHVPLGTHANKQGRVAGINIGGGYATFPGVIGTAVTKVCELEVARTGLTEKEADGGRVRVRHRDGRVDQPGRLLPGRGERWSIKLIAEKRTGLLLGAQIVGRDGGRQADRRAGHRGLEPDDGRGDDGAGPELRAAVLAGVGSGADRGPQGDGRGPRRRIGDADFPPVTRIRMVGDDYAQ